MAWIRPIIAGAGLVIASARMAAEPPLMLETRIPLGEVRGRIDHLAVDPARQRLFVAELGNDSIGVVDLAARKRLRTIPGFKEPQGVGYAARSDTLFVANAGDGSVRLLQGAELSPAGRIDLGDDADNIRIDDKADQVFIGYGSGALAMIDPTRRVKLGNIPLKAHPEAFQLDETANRIYVNVPDARQVAVIDRGSAKQVAAWPLPGARANFPMALDPEGGRVLIVARNPARLIAFDQAGAVAAAIATCGDADDLFVDGKRRRLYVSCGEGVVDVLERRGAGYERLARVPTVSGARTSLFVPSVDWLYLAARASSGEPASIWVFRPTP